MSQQELFVEATRGKPALVGRFPCTQSQQRFWILEQISPGNSSANVALRWELTGRFSADQLETAYRTVIARHEILRTRFAEEDGLPVQDVFDGAEFKLSVIDMRSMPASLVEERVASICAVEAETPFDLSVPGLIRGTLIQLGADRAYLLTTVHHLCFDGFSIRLLGREIGEIAQSLAESREPVLPDLALQYGDYALWQAAYLASSGFETEQRYWTRQLAGAAYFELPTDRPRQAERTYAGTIVSELLSKEVSERLESVAKERGLTVFALSAAILSAVLHRLTGARDIGIGTQVVGRDDTALEDLIGVFINNLVLRFDVAPNASFSDHLTHAAEVVRDALIHQRMPFNTLVEIVNPRRDPARTPLVSVNMIVQRAFLEDTRYGAFELKGRPSSTPGALFDLNFMMIGRPEGWRASLEYNPDLFTDETANAILSAWCGAIDRLTADSSLPLSALPAPTGLPPIEGAETARRVLALHPAVSRAAVLPGEGEGAALRAFVVPSADTALALEDLPSLLKVHLAAHLPQGVMLDAMPGTISVVLRLPGENGRLSPGENIRLSPGENGRLSPGENGRLSPGDTNPSPPRVMFTDRSAGTSSAPMADAFLRPAEDPAVARVAGEVEEIWKDLLGRDTIERSANFFDLGGHSLLAVRMVARLRERLKIEINTGLVYRSPTIGGLAETLAALTVRKADAAEDNRIVVINPDAPGIPILSINNYSTIYAVSKHFAEPRRCITVRLVDPDLPFALPPMSFEELADAYVELVRSVQPKGPYALFGVCVHGNIALEVARRLMAAGDEVAAVFVKDVWSPAYSAFVRDNPRIRRLNKWHDLKVRAKKWRRGEMTIFDVLRHYPSVRDRKLFHAVERFAGAQLSAETRLLDTTSQGAFIAHVTAARNAYTPEPYPGRMVMFVTGEAPSGPLFDRSLGWADIVEGRLDLEEVPDILVHRGLELGTKDVAMRMERVLSKG